MSLSARIRPARPEDAPGILAIYAPFVRETAVSFEVVPPDEPAMARRIAAALERWSYLVAEEEGSVQGYAYAGPFRDRAAYDWTAEVSFYVAAEARRRGVGRALCGAVLEELRGRGFRSAVGIVTLPNAASVALMEGLGFRAVGVLERAGFKLGRWWDVGFWQVALVEGDAPPG
jgi:phosphinothricin acetyltransferase